MADAESSLRTFLLTQAGILTAFGATNTRIYIDRIDASVTVTYPFAIIRTITESMEYAHDGELKDRTLFQVDVYSNAKSTANSGTAAIKTALSGYRGTIGSITAGSSFVVNTRGNYDPDAQLFRRSSDVLIGQNG
jgi:hypothetical protein